MDIKIEKTKEFAKQWIEEGKPCMYRYGYGYKGASARTISKEKALELLPKYSFGMGFYEISFERNRVVDHKSSGPNCTVTHCEGDMVLMFNEYSANDMW